MRTQAYGFAVFHDKDLIAVHHSADALGDNNRGSGAALFAQRGAQSCFRLEVQCTGGIVQEKDIGNAG